MHRDIRSNTEPQRVMRVALPVDLIREMDGLILGGVGGFRTRAEFIVDAIRERVLELSGIEESAGPPPQAAERNVSGGSGARRQSARGNPVPYLAESIEYLPAARHVPDPMTSAIADVVGVYGIQATMLKPVRPGYVVENDAAVDQPEGKTLFGLHNRDYPSLWALRELAVMTHDRPIPIEQFYRNLLRVAWEDGALFMRLEQELGIKCTALFPTNPEKKKTAEAAFRMFAVGEYRELDDGALVSSGPLFEWRTARIVDDGGVHHIGLSSAGWELLDRCVGLTVEEPHPEVHARPFLRYLAVNAQADWQGFVHVVGAAAPDGGITRAELLEHFRSTWPDWTDNEVSTNAAGYVARAREWGLFERKQIQGRYHLTPLGHDLFAKDMKEFFNE